MKINSLSIAVLLLMLLGAFPAFSQAVMSIPIVTGKNSLNTSTLAPGVQDPRWTVKLPGTSVYQNTKASNNCPGNSIIPYPGIDQNVRMIANKIHPAGGVDSDNHGTYIYRTTFNFDCPDANVTQAVLAFTSIGADNNLVRILVNGNPYGLTACGLVQLCQNTNFSITLQAGHISIGTNVIEVEVINESTTQTGFTANGALNITYTSASAPAPSFGLNASYCQGGAIILNPQASTGTITSYVWTIYECDMAGNIVSTVLQKSGSGKPGLYFVPVSELPCGKYYKISLWLAGGCGGLESSVITHSTYIHCRPPVDLRGSTADICLGNQGSIVANLPTGYNPNQYTMSITIPPIATPVWTGAPNVSVSLSPIVTTTYAVTVVDNVTGCAITIPWTINVNNNSALLSLAGSTKCYYGWGGISATIGSSFNPVNFTMNIYQGSTLIYTGMPNVSVQVFQNATTTYMVEVIETATGCKSVAYWTMYMEPCDRKFKVLTNTSNPSYFTMSAIAEIEGEASVPGYGAEWYLEELDPETMDPIYTFAHPACWDLPITVENIFEGIDAVTNNYDGEYNSVSCPSDEGKFLYDRTYRITRVAWDDYEEYDQYSVIVSPSYGKHTGTVNIAVDPNAPDMRKVVKVKEAAAMTSVKAALEMDIHIFPNPATDVATVYMKGTVGISKTIKVFDMLGRQVMIKTTSNDSGELNLEGLSKGAYTIRIETANSVFTNKIILK